MRTDMVPPMTDNVQTPPDAVPRLFGIREDRLAMVLLFVVPALFASNMLMARATADTIPPIALAFWRWSVAFGLLVCIVGPRLWLRRRAIAWEWRDILVLGALGMGVCGTFVYIAADTTTATNIGLIYSASPVLIILLATACFGERLRPIQVAGIGVSLAGVLVVVARGDPSILLDVTFTVGDLWVLAATVAWAAYSVILRYRPSEMGLTTRFAAICGGGILVLLPFTIWEGISVGLPTMDGATVGAVLFIGVVASFGAYQVYAFVQNVLGAGRTALLMYLVPLYNAVLAYLLLDEILQPYHFLGAALVLPGIYLSTRTGGIGK